MKVTKDSIRTLTGRRRLPKRFWMFVSGSWLYDVLKANAIPRHLWSQTYWVVLRSLDNSRMTLTWRAKS
jgi:hypothetical protein